mmetsp:Transcript_76057/g.191426  ORF Transcript_76057/g.191426 Transcript_76057/m.191426 type:complete len:138 (-) Transcript_76057:102-515(-)
MAEETKPRREISEAELAKHNTEDDCWLCLHDLIVQLPKDFLEEHPGGPDVITCLGGKDATNDYEDISHSDSARDWTNKYIIGYKEGADEAAKTKLIPKNSELGGRTGGGGGGGAGPLVPAAFVAILAIIAFFLFKAK